MKNIYLFIFIIILFSGCIGTDNIPISSSGNSTINYYINGSNDGTNFSINITGQPALYNFSTLVAGTNISLTQDTTNHTITITSIGSGGSITLNVTTCNTANQASSYNGTGFECVSIADVDPYILFTSEPNLNVNSSIYWKNLLTPISGIGSSGQYLTSNGSGGTTWNSLPPSGSTISFYLHNNSSTNLSFTSKLMNRTIIPTSSINNITIVGLSNGNTFLGNWTSDSINVHLIPSGVHELHMDARKVGGSGNHIVKLYFVCYMINSTGENLTLHGTSELSNEVLTTETEVDTDLVSMDINTNLTDRMFIQIYANQSGSGALPNLIIDFDDLTDSRLILPATQIDITPLLDNISILQNDVTQLQTNDTKYQNHSNLSNLNWSVANHTINTNVNFNSNQIINSSAIYTYNNQLSIRSLNGSIFSGVAFDGFSEEIRFLLNNGGFKQLILNTTYLVFNDFGIDLKNHNLINCANCWNETVNDTKVNKSGDVMSGKLNMSNNTIDNVEGITMTSSKEFSYNITTPIPNGTRPYQFQVNLSNSSGVNTNTSIFCNNHCKTNFSDVYFTILGIAIPSVIDNTTGKTFINATINGSVVMHYGNTTNVIPTNPNSTMYLYDRFDFNSSKWNYTQSSAGNVQIVSGELRLTGNNNWDVNGITAKNFSKRPVKIEWDSRFSAGSIDALQGYSPNIPTYPVGLYWETGGSTALYRLLNGTRSADFGTLFGTTTTHQKILLNSTGYVVYYNNVQKEINLSWTKDQNYVGFQMFRTGTFMYIDNVTVMDYTYPEPELYTWGVETIENSYTSVQTSWCLQVDNFGVLYTRSGKCI